MGARPMARLIESEIKEPITDDILNEKLCKGNTVTIDYKDDKLFFEIK